MRILRQGNEDVKCFLVRTIVLLYKEFEQKRENQF